MRHTCIHIYLSGYEKYVHIIKPQEYKLDVRWHRGILGILERKASRLAGWLVGNYGKLCHWESPFFSSFFSADSCTFDEMETTLDFIETATPLHDNTEDSLAWLGLACRSDKLTISISASREKYNDRLHGTEDQSVYSRP